MPPETFIDIADIELFSRLCTDVSENAIDQLVTIGHWHGILHTCIEAFSRFQRNARAPIDVAYVDHGRLVFGTGGADCSEADGGLDSTGKERPPRRILIDAIINHAAEVEIFIFSRLIRPRKLGEFLLDWQIDTSRLIQSDCRV